ncbi:hypothetical protein SD960_14800 [Flavobacterium sp. MMLR14_040]|uniref:hypothetical protein n=1 Tax=Flavobacterium sp. MMLR14_040 TaxID=3093843 RepID=UPI00298F6D95|nr:hypothetical protein [Flavobacterium sp. MMLR14_040]MDW8851371.1 hypothetical protein [Flavobacterium sp. MMLR14_040]
MKIELKKYDEQIVAWPKSGYHIMAQYEFVQNKQLEKLMVPAEKPFLFKDEELNKKLKISGNHE